MIILDTAVLSALMRAERDEAVERWLDREPRAPVWTTAITVMEIQFGIALLPVGRRRTQLQRSFVRAVGEKIEDRIMPFETNAAAEAAALMAPGSNAAGAATCVIR